MEKYLLTTRKSAYFLKIWKFLYTPPSFPSFRMSPYFFLTLCCIYLLSAFALKVLKIGSITLGSILLGQTYTSHHELEKNFQWILHYFQYFQILFMGAFLLLFLTFLQKNYPQTQQSQHFMNPWTIRGFGQGCCIAISHIAILIATQHYALPLPWAPWTFFDYPEKVFWLLLGVFSVLCFFFALQNLMSAYIIPALSYFLKHYCPWPNLPFMLFFLLANSALYIGFYMLHFHHTFFQACLWYGLYITLPYTAPATQKHAITSHTAGALAGLTFIYQLLCNISFITQAHHSWLDLGALFTTPPLQSAWLWMVILLWSLYPTYQRGCQD